MGKRIVWLVVSGLMVLSLVLASCAPKVTEVTPTAPTAPTAPTTPTTPTTPTSPTSPTVEVPQYGGTLTLAKSSDTPGFDTVVTGLSVVNMYPLHLTGGFLITNDRTKGPAGTREWVGLSSPFLTQDLLTGSVAESWELDYPNRIILHVRKGIHFHNKPPANGRELTAEDVVFTFVRQWGTPGNSYYIRGVAYFRDMANLEKSVYVDPNDPWTVILETNPEYANYIWEWGTTGPDIAPKELGMAKITRWQDMVGAGPFVQTGYVSGSSHTFTRNPDYWQKDVFYPQNQLPYTDKVKIMIIPDISTRMAALRTGKIDQLIDVTREDAESFWKLNPELLYEKYIAGTVGLLNMRNDVKPFDNVKVRRAMQMAIDTPAILRDYYHGDGELLYWPVGNVPEFAYMWTPLEQMPQSVQELYSYNPDKAKQLLDAAGYPGPNRFTTSIVVNGAEEEDIDVASLVASYWAKVGVTLKIDVKEYAVYTTMSNAKTYQDGIMAYGVHYAQPVKFIMTQRGGASNKAMVDKEYIEEARKAVSINYFDKEKRGRIVKEVTVKMLEDALVIATPVPHAYVFWQPWLKGYHGELYSSYYKNTTFAEYVWIDQALKEKMTGRK